MNYLTLMENLKNKHIATSNIYLDIHDLEKLFGKQELERHNRLQLVKNKYLQVGNVRSLKNAILRFSLRNV